MGRWFRGERWPVSRNDENVKNCMMYMTLSRSDAFLPSHIHGNHMREDSFLLALFFRALYHLRLAQMTANATQHAQSHAPSLRATSYYSWVTFNAKRLENACTNPHALGKRYEDTNLAAYINQYITKHWNASLGTVLPTQLFPIVFRNRESFVRSQLRKLYLALSFFTS